jgi:AcrR family transcriptional regulator
LAGLALTDPEPAPDKLDGRRRRSQDSRARIVAAMVEIVREGDIGPSAADVAARAGVGLRSVFRHFNDMESLYREITEVIEVELRAVAARPFKGGSWRERVLEMIDRRGPGFDQIAPMRRASDARRHGSPVLQDDHNRLTLTLRELLRAQLPPDAVDKPTFAALELLLSYEAWNRLRVDQGLSAAEARKALRVAVKGLIGDGDGG